MKKDGQALVEFIIVLPVIIIILLGIIDFGIIFYKKNYLENTLDEVVDIWKKEQSKDMIKSYLNEIDDNIEFKIDIYENSTIDLILEIDYEVITPGLNVILGDPYQVNVSRVIYSG